MKIDESLRDYVEGLDYEYAARRDVIAFMLENNMNVNSDSFKNYQKEMMEYKIKFSVAKKEIEERYVLPVIGDKKASWVLDYPTSELTITIEEE